MGTKDDVQIAASQRIPAQLRSDCLYLDNGDKKKYNFPGITKWEIFFYGIIVVNFFQRFILLLIIFSDGGTEVGIAKNRRN
jgi:hypothetical protein